MIATEEQIRRIVELRSLNLSEKRDSQFASRSESKDMHVSNTKAQSKQGLVGFWTWLAIGVGLVVIGMDWIGVFGIIKHIELNPLQAQSCYYWLYEAFRDNKFDRLVSNEILSEYMEILSAV